MRRYQQSEQIKTRPAPPTPWGGMPWTPYTTLAKKALTDTEIYNYANIIGASAVDDNLDVFLRTEDIPYNNIGFDRDYVETLMNKDGVQLATNVRRSGWGNKLLIPRMTYNNQLTASKKLNNNYPVYYHRFNNTSIDDYTWNEETGNPVEIQLFYCIYDMPNSMTESAATKPKISMVDIVNKIQPFMDELYTRLDPGIPGEQEPEEEPQEEETTKEACIVNRNLHGWYGVPPTTGGTITVSSPNTRFSGTGHFEISRYGQTPVSFETYQRYASNLNEYYALNSFYSSVNADNSANSKNMYYYGNSNPKRSTYTVLDNNYDGTLLNADVCVFEHHPLVMHTVNGVSYNYIMFMVGIMLPRGAGLPDKSI